MKCRGLALGTGYAEDASWSQLILVHPKGFKTVQDALIDVKAAFEEIVDEAGIRIDDIEDLSVEEVVRTVIRGDYQDYGDLWEKLTDRGWLVGMQWNYDKMDSVKFVGVDRADQLIADAENLTEEAEYLIACPKKIKVLK